MEKIFLFICCILILLNIFIQWQVYIKKNIITFAFGSFLLGIYFFIHGVIYIGILTILIRTIFIPRYMILKLSKEHWREREVYPTIGTASSIIGSILFVILCYVIFTLTLYKFIKFRTEALPLAIILQGIFLIISKRNTFVQLIGYMIMENGVLLFGVKNFPHLPFIFEAGILLDLIGIVMLSSLIGRLRKNYVEDIDELKG